MTEEEIAIQAAAAQAQALARQRAQGGASGRTLVGQFPDNGRIYRMSDGSLSAVSAGGSTVDQDAIQRLMAGDSFSAIMQDDIDQQRIASAPVAARANEFVRGTPFVGSYLDEAVGAVSPQSGENMRRMSDAMRRQKPGQTAALNVGGAVAGAVPMAMAAAPAVLARAPTLRGGQFLAGLTAGGAAGALEGAAYGAGEGETPQERRSLAASGAAIGGVAGGAVGAAAPYVASGLRAILSRLQRSDVTEIASTLGVSREAASVVKNAFETGGIDGAEDALRRSGSGAMLADAGRSTRQLLDASAAAGGRAGEVARSAVSQRTEAASGQIARALDDILGSPQGQSDLIEGIRVGTQGARSQAYDAAYSAPINYSADAGRRLESLLPRVPQSAINAANEIMRTEGVDSAQIIARVADDGRVSYETLPDVRQWHYIMQGLDDAAQRQDGQGRLGGQTPIGRSYANLRSAISGSLRQAVPEFGRAQSIAADAIREQGAVDLGYSLLRPSTRLDEVARQLSGSTKAERDAAALGVRAYLDDMMGNVTRTMTDPDTTTREGMQALRALSSRSNRDKLRRVIGQERTDALLSQIDEAATAFELRAAIAENSRTAIRQSIQSGVEQQTQPGMLTTLASGRPGQASQRLVQAMTGATDEAIELRRMGIYEEIADALTRIRGNEARRALGIIDRAMRNQAELSERQAQIIASTLINASLNADLPASSALQK